MRGFKQEFSKSYRINMFKHLDGIQLYVSQPPNKSLEFLMTEIEYLIKISTFNLHLN